MRLEVAERLYRLLYHGLLTRLSEARAVGLGQALLRAVPVDALPGFTLADPRLAVDLGGVRLPNPVILASMYYDARILRRTMGLGFGAVTTKSITVSPRPGHPEPSLVRLATSEGPGFINCNGFKNPGLATFRTSLRSLPRRCPVIVSIAGESPEEYRQLAEELGPVADLVEVNISSPNTRLVYELSAVPARVRALLNDLRVATARPIIVKLSPDYPEENRQAIVPAILDTGIEVVNFGNTRRVPHAGLSQRAGGLSGPPLFTGVLTTVRELRRAVGRDVGLIATGGIDTPEKALHALEAGADAVSFFTAFVTRGPTLPRRINELLLDRLERQGATRLAELRST